ncbi:MAG: DUF899 family protein [Hyphomicrobiaceae bacterium]
MPVTFPNESGDYRAARNALLDAEIALRAQIEAVAEMRRALPAGGEIPEDYVFADLEGGKRSLSSLFGGHPTLALYSYMFAVGDVRPCPACTSLIDGLNGLSPQIMQRIAFHAVSSATPTQLTAIKEARGWSNVSLLSADGTEYQTRYHGRTADGEQPMMNIFSKQNGIIRHVWSTEMLLADLSGHPRHMDLAWPIWNILDMTPEGRGDFFPEVFD